MSGEYLREMDFMYAALRRLRVRFHILRPGDDIAPIDGGLRALLGLPESDDAFPMDRSQFREKTVYRITDPFLRNFVFFLLPGPAPAPAAVIGPYLTQDPTREMLLEQSERLGAPMQSLSQQTDYYAALPVFADPSALLSIVYTLADVLWGGSFDTEDMNAASPPPLPAQASAEAPMEQNNILDQMKLVEQRYAYEAELMEVVSRGQTNQVELLLSGVSRLNFQQRLPDPLRNMKNYCIILNTLLRKAAQQGGVHPLYLDRTSSRFAHLIEGVPSLEKCNALVADMIRTYCRLVRTHAAAPYSAAVQKALVYIDANLSGNLSLTELAALMQLSPGYLSSLFHRETGSSLSAYILHQRMQAARRLLASTRLQVQTVAQLCGFSDPNYFGKQFRRCCGASPQQYRRHHIGPAVDPASPLS